MNLSKHDIILKSRKKLFLEFHGEHPTMLNGEGLEFSEVREYDSNDDIRHINWKITARKQKPTVNLFQEHKQLTINIVYLLGGGLHFGVLRSKRECAIEIVTALSYAISAKKDLLGVHFFDSEERFSYGPTRGKNIVDIVFDKALEIDVLGREIDYEKLVKNLMEKIKRRSIVVLIGDFLELPDFKILASKHELYCVIIRERAEENLDFLGEIDMVDSATYAKKSLHLDEKTRREYRAAMEQHDRMLFSHFRACDIRYEKIYTDDDIYTKLAHLTRI